MHNFFAIEVEAEHRRFEQERRIAAMQLEIQQPSPGRRYARELWHRARACLNTITSSVLATAVTSERERCSAGSARP